MNICLCNLSADKLLEILAQRGDELEPATPDIDTFVADAASVKDVLADIADLIPKPIELLVGNARKRRATREISCHVWNGSLPRNGLMRLGEGMYVTSPELTLLQQASQLHQVNLCQMLGRYLGTWTKGGRDTDLKERAPLTTFEHLNELLASIGRTHGRGNLSLAMSYVCERAASAPETALQLVLSLPPYLHGFGLPLPTMNHEIELSGVSERLYPHKTIRIDLCWHSSKFGLEYQGEEHGKQMGADYARWFAARNEGYELWFVAKEQLECAAQMDYIGHEVAKRLGIVVDEELWPSPSELQELLDTLSGKTHPHPIGYNELRRRRAAVHTHLRRTSHVRGSRSPRQNDVFGKTPVGSDCV